MFDFTGQVIVVTGAAGNLGRAVATGFLEAGGLVCGLDHRQGRLGGMFSHVEGNFRSYEGIDLTDREAVLTAGEKIRQDVGQVDVLVCTVGGFTMGERVDQITSETWQKIMDINVISLLNSTAAFIPGMVTAGHGKVVTIGSGASLKGSARMGAYAAAKAAVLRLTESMSAELKSTNIQVNCVLPGTIDSPQNRQAMPDADLSRWVTPEQVAQAILFLSSPDADAITGAALPVMGRA